MLDLPANFFGFHRFWRNQDNHGSRGVEGFVDLPPPPGPRSELELVEPDLVAGVGQAVDHLPRDIPVRQGIAQEGFHLKIHMSERW